MQSVSIIGAGIVGMTCAYVLNRLEPRLDITLIDAAPEPWFGSKDTFLRGHVGATLGHSSDARHFTGSEGLSLQNPVHTRLVFERASGYAAGWQTIPEAQLTAREKKWRQEVIDRYNRDVTPQHNPYDDMHAVLNYGGMEAWSYLESLDSALSRCKLSPDHIYVAFENERALHDDFSIESRLSPLNEHAASKVSIVPDDVLGSGLQGLHKNLLRVPGSSWRIQSAWKHLYDALRKTECVTFRWNNPISKAAQLSPVSAYVWAAGTTAVVPDVYAERGRAQGIGGYWLSMPNPGFTISFKISAPQPNGYINFTPDGDALHVSGGFGWVGERGFEESASLLRSVKTQFITAVSRYLGRPAEEVESCGRGYCIRPTTPTGLPDIQQFSSAGSEHVMLSGSGKAGATHAPLLALHTARSLGIDVDVPLQSYREQSPASATVLDGALRLLETGLEPAANRDR